jgi:LuxR family transcriptional regulator, maltose regulon positive regulatory protein
MIAPVPALTQGIARILCGDLDGGDACLQDAISVAAGTGSHEVLAFTLFERSLIAVTRGKWSRAGDLTSQARTVLRQAGIEESYAAGLVCAVQARVALHMGDFPAARRELVNAQRLRSLLTYAYPHFAVQARIELIHAHLALADLAGARTLMVEIDEVLRRRPALGTLVGEARSLRDRLAKERGAGAPGASALTAAELRLLPLLSTHLSFPEIAAELFVSRSTIKTQVLSIYRKLGASSRNHAVGRARELGLLEG